MLSVESTGSVASSSKSKIQEQPSPEPGSQSKQHQQQQQQSQPQPQQPATMENDLAQNNVYVNLEMIKQRKAATSGQAAAAPPLPPKPPQLSSSHHPSALASRLIDHLYTSARVQERMEMSRSSPRPKKKHSNVVVSYTVPEGPPRPISPTEMMEKQKRHQKKQLRHRVLQKFLPKSKQQQQQQQQQQKFPQIQVSSDFNDNLSLTSWNGSGGDMAGSSTCAEASDATGSKTAERPTDLNFRSLPMDKKLAAATTAATTTPYNPRSLFMSPMSTSSFFDNTKRKEGAAVAAAGAGGRFGAKDDSSYCDDTSASSPSTSVVMRIERAEAHHQKMLLIAQQQQLRMEAGHSPCRTLTRDRPTTTTKGGAKKLAVPEVAPSMSSGLSEDTLADLPSIEELPATAMKRLEEEEKKAIKFKEYMNNLGVEIDLSVFQSTEV